MAKEKQLCTCCGMEKYLNTEFYVSNSPIHKHTKRLTVCKACLVELAETNKTEDGYDLNEVKNTLRMIDRPFLSDLWNAAVTEHEESGKVIFKLYIKNLQIKDYRNATWSDSDADDTERIHKTKNVQDTFSVTDRIIDKWGVGYRPQEYEYFERKYNILKNNYQEKTSMHTEALLTYVRYRVKEEMATAEGNVKDAKDWGALAQKAAQDAKINPSQLSKADLSDGLDTFGQLVRTVETAVDIIPLLPQFKARPHDKPDFTMWCYINYIRDLKGLPLAEYEDIYQFYENRKKEYENRFDFLQDSDDE